MWLSPCASPTDVVDLPSPSGVGVIAVTTTYLPRGRSASRRRIASSVTLAFVGPYSSSSPSAMPRSRATSTIGRGVTDRAISRSDGKLIGLLDWSGGAEVAAIAGSSGHWRSAARTRWVSNRALVSGPTPPGTGVIAEATARADSKSTSPTMWPSTTLIPTSTTTAPGRSMEPVTRPGTPGGDDHDLGPSDVAGEVAGPRVADGDRGVLLDEQEGRRHPDDGRTADDDGVATLDLDPRPPQDLHRCVGRGRQESVVAKAEQPRVERMDPVDVLGRIDRVDDGAQADRRRQRHLDDDAVHRRDRR